MIAAPFKYDPINYMDVHKLRINIKNIMTCINYNMNDSAAQIISRTISDIQKYSIRGLERYSENILQMFNTALLMIYINEIEEVIALLSKIKEETRMPCKIAKHIFMKNVDDLPLDIKEYIVNMV